MALRRSGAKELEKLIRHTRLALNRSQAGHDGRALRTFESSLTRETHRSQDWKDFSNTGKRIPRTRCHKKLPHSDPHSGPKSQHKLRSSTRRILKRLDTMPPARIANLPSHGVLDFLACSIMNTYIGAACLLIHPK